MPALDIIPNGIVYELSDGPRLNFEDETQNDVYAFGLALDEGLPYYQVQRWFILTRNPARRPPTRSLTLKPTEHNQWKTADDKGPFVAASVARQSANSFYAKVNCVRQFGGVLPRNLPVVQSPGNPDGQFQPDIGTTHLNVGPGLADTVGFIHVVRNGAGRTQEQWILLQNYLPSAGTTKLELLDTSTDFSDLMNRRTWNQNTSTLVSCGCSYFTVVPPLNEA